MNMFTFYIIIGYMLVFAIWDNDDMQEIINRVKPDGLDSIDKFIIITILALIWPVLVIKIFNNK